MPDTPLHAHPAVLWLMTTEHWPKQRVGLIPIEMTLANTGFEWVWSFASRITGGRTTAPCSDDLAHSLLTLAAVEALWAKGYMPRQWHSPGGLNKEACACRNYETGNFFGPYGTIWLQPTKLLATLAAVEAVCMENSK